MFSARLADGLRSLGWVAQTVSLTKSGDARVVDLEPLTDVSSARPGRFNRSISKALSRRIKDFDPDVVVANGGSTLRYGAVATLSTRPPLVYMAIGEPRYWIRNVMARAANRWMLGRASMVLAVCEATASQIVEMAPSLAGKIHVTYTGVPDEMFTVRRSTGGANLRVVVLGSLSDEKDPLLAVRAVARVPGVMLRLVGGGPLSGDVASEVESLGVEARVELVGAVDDVLPHLEWADVLLLTSRTEGLPGAILEAGAASLATVAVDVGGVREAVSDGVSGIVVDRDEESLVRAITEMASDPAMVRRMGLAARLHMKEQFAMDHIISGYAARLAEVVA